MMGVTHALSGVAAGLYIAPLVGVDGPAGQILFALVLGGYTLLNDLDHPSSSCSRILAPVTNPLSFGVRKLSAFVYQLTKGPRDERVNGEHRHLTHTLAWAIGMGFLAQWAGSQGPWWVAAIIVIGLLLAEDRLGDWVPVAAGAAGLLWWGTQPAGTQLTSALTEMTDIVGLAVALGCLVHDLGDMLTESGVPLLWPLPIAGETWYEIRPPALIRFRTGGSGEVAFTILLVAALGWWTWQLASPHLPTYTAAGSIGARPRPWRSMISAFKASKACAIDHAVTAARWRVRCARSRRFVRRAARNVVPVSGLPARTRAHIALTSWAGPHGVEQEEPIAWRS